jgi:hypothetical protein
MPYFRRPKDHEHPYAQISNAMLEDPELSFKAKGILSYLLSRCDEWDVYQSQLAELGPDGGSAVRSGIEELMEAGYLNRKKRRNDDGTFEEWEYIVRETPVDGAASRTRFSNTGSSNTGSSNTGESQPTNTDEHQDGQHQNGEGGGEITDAEELTVDLVMAWRDVRGAPPMTEGIEQALHRWAKAGTVTDPDLFAEVLRGAVDSTAGRNAGIDLKILRESYENQESAQTSKYMPSDDPDLDL